MHEYLLELIKTCVDAKKNGDLTTDQWRYTDNLLTNALRLLDDDLTKAAAQKQGVHLVKP